MAKDRNPIIQKGLEIGAVDAEFDAAFLMECFIDNSAYSTVSDFENNKMILAGRTGSGKTALFKHMEVQREDECSYISLPEMALSYVTNSDYINFLLQLGTDLELFFEALWKHVIILEYVRSAYSISNTDQSRSLTGRLLDFFNRDERRKKGVDYLQRWESKFWVTMDENIREITKQVEDKVNAEFGLDVERLKTNVGYVASMSAVRRQQYEFRAKKIINSDLLVELSTVIDVLSSFSDRGSHNQKKRFIFIDKVDEKWVDERIKYQLIRSLMEALKSLRRIRHLKVIVAMRTDVLATVIAKSEQPGLQRDKYDDFIVDLEWGQKELRALVDKRVGYLYRRKYTKDNVLFSDIFSRQVSQKPAFDYMIERTLLRPRDIISFTNLALGAAQGKNEVPAKDIKDAEARYSKQRYEALTQEWIVAFPWLRDAFRILRVGATRFSVSAIPGALIEDFVAALLSEDTRNSEIHRLAKRAVEAKGSGSMSVVVFEALAVLYRIGAVGLKLNANERYRYAYIDNATVNATDIDLDTKVHIHPMLQRALGVYDDQRTGRSSD